MMRLPVVEVARSASNASIPVKSDEPKRRESSVSLGYRKRPSSVNSLPLAPPPTQVPLMEKQPAATFRPLANVEVPLGLMLMPFEPSWRANRVPGVEEPMPMRPKGLTAVEIVKIGVFPVEVAILKALATAFGIVVVLEIEWMMLPPKSAVLEALKGPETLRPPKTEEEAVERKPPWRVERFFTNNVLEAFRAPDS